MMKPEHTPGLIVIDDDSLNNLICRKIIQQAMPAAIVQTFTSPEKGLEHMLLVHANMGTEKTVLFLDINMPFLSGWDVLERMNDFPDDLKKHFKIFMLSSSVDSNDKTRADDHPLICGYITKPLSQAKLSAIFS